MTVSSHTAPSLNLIHRLTPSKMILGNMFSLIIYFENTTMVILFHDSPVSHDLKDSVESIHSHMCWIFCSSTCFHMSLSEVQLSDCPKSLCYWTLFGSVTLHCFAIPNNHLGISRNYWDFVSCYNCLTDPCWKMKVGKLLLLRSEEIRIFGKSRGLGKASNLKIQMDFQTLIPDFFCYRSLRTIRSLTYDLVFLATILGHTLLHVFLGCF